MSCPSVTGLLFETFSKLTDDPCARRFPDDSCDTVVEHCGCGDAPPRRGAQLRSDLLAQLVQCDGTGCGAERDPWPVDVARPLAVNSHGMDFRRVLVGD